MTARPVHDVSALPSVAFGHRMPIWWGTLGFMVIEGMAFVMAVAAYFYMATQSADWPMGVSPPGLIWGSVLLGLFFLSEVPNHWTKGAAERFDTRRVRIGICIMAAIGILALGVRAFEFTTLNVRWDTNAYGSIVWALLVMHTLHIATDVAETIVMAVMMFVAPLDARRFVDVSENAEYWDFVVLSWVPLYAVLYWAPRWMAP
jgi:heme/copper-type cytochrome/quinol oxidase subunit 3